MKLINPTDDELDAAFDTEIAHWKPTPEELHATDRWNEVSGWESDPADAISRFRPKWSRSFDAVLPWLEKFSHKNGEDNGGEPIVFRLYSPACEDDVWTVQPVWMHHDGDIEESGVSDKSLPRAAVIALLRANGVEIEFTK